MLSASEHPAFEHELQASPFFRALAGLVCALALIGSAFATLSVIRGVHEIDYLWALPLVLSMAFAFGYIALRGRVPFGHRRPMSPMRYRLAMRMRTRSAMIAVGTVFFGGWMAVLNTWLFPIIRDMDLPATLIMIVSCLLVGACFGEAMWRIRELLPWSMKRLPESE